MIPRLLVAAWLLSLLAAPVLANGPSSGAAGLDDQAQCVPFRWLPGHAGARGAISVPVVLDGRRLALQLDTGSDATILYGGRAAAEGWVREGVVLDLTTRVRLGLWPPAPGS